jgi:hypothetical protein
VTELTRFNRWYIGARCLPRRRDRVAFIVSSPRNQATWLYWLLTISGHRLHWRATSALLRMLEWCEERDWPDRRLRDRAWRLIT